MQFRWGLFEANLDPVVGSEQSGTRPVLVVSDEDSNLRWPNLTVVPLTSTERRLYPAEVLIEARLAGQPKKSIILAHQIRTISKLRLGKRFGYLDEPGVQQSVLQAILEHLDAFGIAR